MTNPADTLADLRARHTKAYVSTGDEVWGRSPICAADGHVWPCEVAEALAAVEAEVAHRVNPVIGWLRLAERDAAPPSAASHERLTETVAFFSQES